MGSRIFSFRADPPFKPCTSAFHHQEGICRYVHALDLQSDPEALIRVCTRRSVEEAKKAAVWVLGINWAETLCRGPFECPERPTQGTGSKG